MQTTRALSTLFGFAALLIAAPASAQGQDASSYPSRPIKIIVAVPAGGGVDLSARIVADQLQKLWGQPVTVENRTGGGNNVAGEAVAKADPDGYTLLATPPNIVTVNAVLYKQLNYDPAALEPVAIMAVGPNVLAVKDAFAGEIGGRPHRAGKGQPRKTQLRLAGQRFDHASDRRVVREPDRHQDHARTLPRRGAGRERSGRRARRYDVLRSRHHPAAGSGRARQDYRHGDARPPRRKSPMCRRSMPAASRGSARRRSSH